MTEHGASFLLASGYSEDFAKQFVENIRNEIAGGHLYMAWVYAWAIKI